MWQPVQRTLWLLFSHGLLDRGDGWGGLHQAADESGLLEPSAPSVQPHATVLNLALEA